MTYEGDKDASTIGTQCVAGFQASAMEAYSLMTDLLFSGMNSSASSIFLAPWRTSNKVLTLSLLLQERMAYPRVVKSCHASLDLFSCLLTHLTDHINVPIDDVTR